MNAGYLKNWITKADNDLEIVKHELKLPEYSTTLSLVKQILINNSL